MKLFGYGSLISTDSRSRTASSGSSQSFVAKGMQRCFGTLNPELGMSSAVVYTDPQAQCNGILFSVNEEELQAFDQREFSAGYDRIPLQSGPPNSEVYVLPNKPLAPTAQAPIVQSYVDVILAGCLEINDAFALAFIEQTTSWEYAWINDRERPIYVRPLSANQSLYKKIDAILAEGLGQERLLQRDATSRFTS